MKTRITIVILTLIITRISFIHATPSTIIWIPSVDFQGYKSFHLGIDNYAYDFKSGKPYSGGAFPTDLGLTVGVLPDSMVQAEIGVDYFTPQWSPFLVNAKVGFPEGAFVNWSPAIAIGGFGFGFQKNVTDFNILYGIVGKSLPVIGRIEVGYYSGNKNLLVDLATGKADNSGFCFRGIEQFQKLVKTSGSQSIIKAGKAVLVLSVMDLHGHFQKMSA